MTIECLNFKKHESGSLQGFADIRVPKMGIEMLGCTVFSKNGKRWLMLPSREFIDKETGEKKYAPTIRFVKKEHIHEFCKIALQAVDEYRNKTNME